MSIRDINLLPDHILYRTRRNVRKMMSAMAVLLIIAFVAAGALALPYIRTLKQNKLTTLKQKIDQKALEEYEQVVGAHQKIKADKKEAQLLAASVPKQGMDFTKLTQSIKTLLPKTTTITEWEYTTASGALTIFCTSEDRKEIATFLKKLHDDILYTDINVSGISGSMGLYECSVTIRIDETKH